VHAKKDLGGGMQFPYYWVGVQMTTGQRAALSQGRLLSFMSVGRVRRTLEHICWMTVDGAEWWACLSIGPAVDRAEWPI
jgi:hypothetical protein